MMFGALNNIAKLAEDVVFRWAVKRVFKFLLKKKVGQFILGDIDLDQLDVQLTEGSIQLSDLALNVDYLNQKVRRLLPGLYVRFFGLILNLRFHGAEEEICLIIIKFLNL